MAGRGRPRKLKEVADENNASVAVVEQDGFTKPVEKSSSFDKWDVSKYTPYDPTVPLPKSKLKVNAKTGKVAVLEQGEPRYYFSQNKKELICVFHARSKKTRLAWMCRPNHSNPKIKADHLAFRKALLAHGIPTRGTDF